MKRNLSLLITIILLSIGVFFINFYTHGEKIPLRKPLAEFPLNIGSWYGKELSFEEDINLNLRTDDHIIRVYEDINKIPIWLYIGYFKSQKEGTLYHSPKHCYPASGWAITNKMLVEIPSFSGGNILINKMIIVKGREKQIVFYWYQSRGRIITNEYLDKFFLIVDAIRKNRTDGSLIRISSPLILDEKTTTNYLIEFTKMVIFQLPDYLPD